ncbi:MAG: VpsF family polysaccharide biosynthesis protein [Acetobacteraceae bacterium]|nr:VpsF family polysaccharide biosynthesis protein [Pseudomonadota bacterium]
MRSLRTLAPVRPTNFQLVRGNQRLTRLAVVLALLSVILILAISGNSLALLGVRYAETGGLPFEKLHPGTYLVALAAMLVLLFRRPAGSGLIRLFREAPALAMFNVLMLACALYSVANVGISGAAVYIESFLSAGMLAIVLREATDRQKRALAWIILFFCIVSIVMSIYEGATQTHLIPMHVADEKTMKMLMQEDSDEFRGDGLFTHPLTAAFVTAMSVFMLLRMRMNGVLQAILFTVLLIGLLSFGGRAALGTTVAGVSLAASVRLLFGLVRRDLPLGFVGAITAAVLFLPPLLLAVISSTDIGDRIIAHMYIDDSAKVRNIQWLVLNHLNTHDVVFGVPLARMEFLKYQIGLATDTTDIENFWLLMFLNLGVMGFVVFLVALFMLMVHLGRQAAHPLGWLLILAAIAIDSTSNSLGRKSIDLFMLVAVVMAMTGYRTSLVSLPSLMRRRPAPTAASLQPYPARLAGVKP